MISDELVTPSDLKNEIRNLELRLYKYFAGILIAHGLGTPALARLGVAAKFPFSVHPHMLRHACGHKLANDGRRFAALMASRSGRNHNLA